MKLTAIQDTLYEESLFICVICDRNPIVNPNIFAVCKDSYVVHACGLTETENENDSANQNDVAKMT